METEGRTCQSFAYVQLTGRFKLDKETFDFTNEKTDFELDLCTNDEHTIGKMYKLLLKTKMEVEYVKDCTIKWAKNEYNIL